jgi:hypothetical protein
MGLHFYEQMFSAQENLAGVAEGKLLQHVTQSQTQSHLSIYAYAMKSCRFLLVTYKEESVLMVNCALLGLPAILKVKTVGVQSLDHQNNKSPASIILADCQ